MEIRKPFERIVAGVLIPSVLLPSCTSYFIDEKDVISINNTTPISSANSDAVPMDITIDTRDYKVINFLLNFVPQIIKNPKLAKQFAENPSAVTQSYGLEELNLNFDDGLWKVIMALGDEDIHKAVVTNDVMLFFVRTKGINGRTTIFRIIEVSTVT